jgi:hypothetical protein
METQPKDAAGSIDGCDRYAAPLESMLPMAQRGCCGCGGGCSAAVNLGLGGDSSIRRLAMQHVCVLPCCFISHGHCKTNATAARCSQLSSERKYGLGLTTAILFTVFHRGASSYILKILI